MAALIRVLAGARAAIFAFTPVEAGNAASGGQGAWALTVLAAAADGAAFGLLPIGWIVLAAIFLYALTVEAGQFEIVSTPSCRCPAIAGSGLLIAFCFRRLCRRGGGLRHPGRHSGGTDDRRRLSPAYARDWRCWRTRRRWLFGALGTDHHPCRVTGLDLYDLSAMGAGNCRLLADVRSG